METVVGIFRTRSQAEQAIERFRSKRTPDEKINLLAPHAPASGRTAVPVSEAGPVSETEQPGVGKAIGGVVGGAIGAATGVSLGAAAAATLIPGVGPVIALGILGGLLAGAAGAKAGKVLDEDMAGGLAVDELFVYEDALRKGRSVVIIQADDGERADAAKKMMEETGAESVDAARESWWVGLRDAEQEHYTASGGDFKSAEADYRRGFESALRPQNRNKDYDEAVAFLKARHPDSYANESFRHGYERGHAYYRSLIETNH